MAKRYQKVLVTTWIGETIRDASDAARVLFFYLLTGPETTLLTGIVPASIGTIAHRLRWSEDKVRATMAELVADGSVVHDEDAGVTWLSNAIEHNPPINPSIVRSWEGKWNEVPKCPLKVAAYQVLRSWCTEKGGPWLVAFDAGCKAPKLSARGPASPQKPAAFHNAGHDAGHHDHHHAGHGVPHQKQYQEQKQKQNPGESACAGAPAPARAFDKSPDTSPSGRVIAEVVSTEPPPSRLPPVPVEVAPSVPATVPPSSHATGPLAASDAEDDDQPPPAQRCPSTPRPGPVAAVATAAPVEAAPAVTPAPPVAAPSAPVAASPSGQTALLPDLAPVPVPAEDAPPVAIPRVADLDERTPANRVLRVWGATCYRAHQQPLATEARRRVVRDRLRVFSEADLIRALTGAMADPYVNGQSDRAPSGGQRDIAWLFAKVERVEGFLRAAAPPPPPAGQRLLPVRKAPPLPPGAPVLTLAEFETGALQALAPRRYSVADLDAILAGGPAHV